MPIERDFHNGVKDVLRKWAYEPANPENMQAIFEETKEVAKRANSEVAKTKEQVTFSIVDVETKDNDVIVQAHIQFKDGGKSFKYIISGKVEGEVYENSCGEEVPF